MTVTHESELKIISLILQIDLDFNCNPTCNFIPSIAQHASHRHRKAQGYPGYNDLRVGIIIDWADPITDLHKYSPDTNTGARVTSIDEYNKTLDYLQSQGYNEIDTARSYVGGKQESFTKEAHWQDRGLTLATKCYPKDPGQHSAERITASLNKSLEELGTKCVDIFYLHAAGMSCVYVNYLPGSSRTWKYCETSTKSTNS